MTKTGKKLAAILLAISIALTITPAFGMQAVYAADEPAAIQDTYELDGVTYFDVGSSNFTGDQIRFFKDMLGSRSNVIRQQGEWDEQEHEYKYYDQSEADLWLQTGVMLLTDLEPNGLRSGYRNIRSMFNAAVRGSDSYDDQNGMIYQATRFDVDGRTSPREAEEWVFQKTFGTNKDFGYFKDDSSEQLTLASAVNVREQYYGQTANIYTIAAYFNNFRISALIPSDEGTNYVTELITDTVNSKSTTASTVKNLTASTVTGSQTVSNTISASVSNSLNGSKSYSKSFTKKLGASYKFGEAFQVSGEAAWTEGEAFSTGWGSSDSVSKSKTASYTVSIPMSPYTQAMITQSDTTAVYLTRYNCPITLLYDVTIVGYQTGQLGDGIMHTSDTQILVDNVWIPIDRDAVYSFSDPLEGARGDLDTRIKGCDNWGEMDKQGLRWYMILNNSPVNYDLTTAPDAIAATQSHVPMSSTGGSYTQTVNVVASEVTGLMPTHPLYRVKIAEPSVNIHSDEVSYKLFDYFTANMEVGDYSYANYMNLVGLNRYDVPFYGFSKDNGYWIITDKEGNELDPADSPVLLEKDPVSTNWRYTAVKPGTCFMVYRIDEDAYYIADRPNDPIKNEDLMKTAALEIIVTEKDPLADHKHKMVRTSKKLPTCTESGNILYYTCSVCSGVFTDYAGNNEIDPLDTILKATGHKWNKGSVTKQATTTATGTKVYTCTSCGKKKSEVIAKLAKKANPLTISAKTATVKYSKLKNKNQTLAVTKVIKFTKDAKDKKTYTLSSAKQGSKSFKKYFKINKSTGKVTVKKGLKKGTYKVKVKVKAAGNSNYLASAVKAVTFTIKVK